MMVNLSRCGEEEPGTSRLEIPQYLTFELFSAGDFLRIALLVLDLFCLVAYIQTHSLNQRLFLMKSSF